MLFGVACLYMMAYGTFTLFGGLISPFIPKTIKKATTKVTSATEEYRRDDLKMTHGEGIFDDGVKIRLANLYPALVALKNEELDGVLFTTYRLTQEEWAELKTMLDPVELFEMWSGGLPDDIRRIQRAQSLKPVIDFLMKIPDLRRE